LSSGSEAGTGGQRLAPQSPPRRLGRGPLKVIKPFFQSPSTSTISPGITSPSRIFIASRVLNQPLDGALERAPAELRFVPFAKPDKEGRADAANDQRGL